MVTATPERVAPAKRSKPRSGRVVRIKPTDVSPKAPAITEPASASNTASGDPVLDMLARYDFKFTRETIDLSKVDRDASLRNQARIAKPINEDQALLYSVAMENGDKFPPIVVYPANSGFIVMDGNHRVAAFDLSGVTTAEAYVVQRPSQTQVEAFTYEANTKHGLPTSLNDRMKQAIHLVDRGMKVQDAARQLSLRENQLRSAIDAASAERRFEELGVKKFDRLTGSARRRLDAIHSNVVLKAAAELALDSGMSVEDITSLAKKINATRNERDQLAVVASERETRKGTIKATVGGRIPIPTQLVTLQRIDSTIIGLDQSKVVAALSALPDDVRDEYLRAAQKASVVLTDIVFATRAARV